MSSDERWMTEACAKKFVGSKDAESAFDDATYKPIFDQFFSQKSKTWFQPAGLRSRTVGVPKGAPRPGSRKIGQLKITKPGQRAWVWEDDWSIIGEPLAKPHFWMIAVGKRSKDSAHQDLQEIGKSILHDPHDSWRPTEKDYRELSALRSSEEFERNRDAIHAARERAHNERNKAIPVDLQDIRAEIAEAYLDDKNHKGVVIEYFTVRYFIISRLYENGDYVPTTELENLASHAFDDLPEEVEWGRSAEETGIVEDLKIDPATSVCFAAELPTD